jgi:Lhr-like helicase
MTFTRLVVSVPVEMSLQERLKYEEYCEIIRKTAWQLHTTDPTEWAKLASIGYSIAKKGLWAMAKRRTLLSSIQAKFPAVLNIIKQNLNKKTLLFSESIKSIETLKQYLLQNQIQCDVYHSKQPKKHRDIILKAWEQGKFPTLLSCMPPDTFILTPEGVVKLGEIKKGDKVLSLKELDVQVEEDTVVAVREREADENVIEIQPHYLPKLTLSKDHPIYVRVQSWVRPTRNSQYYRRIRWAGWIPAGILAEYFKRKPSTVKVYIPFVYPKKIVDIPELNENRLKLLGYYLAEGTLHSDTYGYYCGVNFSLGASERDLAEEISSLIQKEFNNINVKITPWKNAILVYASPKRVSDGRRFFKSDRTLANFFWNYCGGHRHAPFKEVSPEILLLPPEKQMVLINACARGDGHVENTEYGRRMSIITTSETLAKQLLIMLVRNKRMPSFNIRKPESHLYGKRIIRSRRTFHVVYYAQRKWGRYCYREKDIIWVPIYEIREKHYKGRLIDIKTAKNNNFFTISGLAHNCTALEEGLDVKSAEVGIFLASGKSPRKVKQRIGRILRYMPGKIARIYVIWCKGTIERDILTAVQQAIWKVK